MVKRRQYCSNTFSPAARINPARLNAKPKQCVPIGLFRLSMVSYSAIHGVSCNTRVQGKFRFECNINSLGQTDCNGLFDYLYEYLKHQNKISAICKINYSKFMFLGNHFNFQIIDDNIVGRRSENHGLILKKKNEKCNSEIKGDQHKYNYSILRSLHLLLVH